MLAPAETPSHQRALFEYGEEGEEDEAMVKYVRQKLNEKYNRETAAEIAVVKKAAKKKINHLGGEAKKLIKAKLWEKANNGGIGSALGGIGGL